MTRTTFITLSICACLVLPLGAQSAPSKTPELQAADRITAAVLKADLSFLASDEMKGRDTPSPELDRAADWIARRFEQLGLEPAFGKSFFQGRHFGVRASASGSLRLGDVLIPLTAEHIQVPGHGTDGRWQLAVLAMPMPSRKSDLPEHGAIAGRAVLITRKADDPEPPRRQRFRLLRSAMRWLREAGARAIILPPSYQVSSRFFRGSETVMIYLGENRSADVGENMKDASLVLDVPRSKAPFARNVGGLIRGSDKKLRDEIIAFTAHYDHIGTRSGEGDVINNGADDDGTGTVSVMSIAAAMKALPRAPARTTLFLLFYGEEKGFLGSRLYCREPALPLAQTRAVFNIEMVGRPEHIGPRCAWITGWSQSNFGELIVPAGMGAGIKFYENKKGRLSERLFRASDNWPFVELGVPAHSISAGSLHEDYHRPSDEVSKIDFENMTAVVRGIFAAGHAMADGGRTPVWREGSRHAEAARKLRAAKPR